MEDKSKTKHVEVNENNVRNTRIQKLATFAQNGVNPYKYSFDKDAKASFLQEKYKDLAKDELPKTENLIDTIKRVVEYWNSDIKPELEKGKNVIIAAHGNSLRGLIKYLDNMSDEDVIKLELQTGNPICYELDDNLKPIRHYYLKK